MNAVVLSIGSEILSGTLLDTNAQHYARELTTLGLTVSYIAQIADDRSAIRNAIDDALKSARLVLMTGGLGPTGDDLTREAISDIVGAEPVVDPELLERILAHFASRGQTMPEQNAKQAWRIPGVRIIPNPNGTAPGWVIEHGGSFIVALPGPPRENQPMWRNQILPVIMPRIVGQVIVSRTLKTIGLGESAVVARLEGLMDGSAPSVATYAKQDGVHIRVSAVSPEHAQAVALVDAAIADIRERIGDHIYGDGDDSLASAVVAPLATAGVKMAVWEAGSAGRIADLLQGDPLARTVVPEIHVSTYELARSALDGQDDVEIVARRAARAIARSSGIGTSLGLAVKTTPEDVVDRTRGAIGICLIHPDGVVVRTHTAAGSEDEIRRRAMLWTAELLWFELRAASGLRPTEYSTSQLSRSR